MSPSAPSPRYRILGCIFQGGTSSVYLARMSSSAGFSRLVAIKQLRPEHAGDPRLVGMLAEEARLAGHVRHANVVDTLDLLTLDSGPSLVLEYVEGESLATLVGRTEAAGEAIPVRIVVAIAHGMLRGLHAVHEACREDGLPLGIVHGAVSPSNVVVGIDGVVRIIDFGQASGGDSLEGVRSNPTAGAPSAGEPPRSRPGRQVDVYAAGVIVWELLAGRPLSDAGGPSSGSGRSIPPPSTLNPEVPTALDAIVMRALTPDLGARYRTARDFGARLEPWLNAAEDEVGEWVLRFVSQQLAARASLRESPASSPPGRRDSGAVAHVPGEHTRLMPYAYDSRSMALPLPRRPSSTVLAGACALVLILAAGVFVRVRASTVRPEPIAEPRAPPVIPPVMPEPPPSATSEIGTSTADAPETPDPAVPAESSSVARPSRPWRPHPPVVSPDRDRTPQPQPARPRPPPVSDDRASRNYR